jgi:hypothetical protein
MWMLRTPCLIVLPYIWSPLTNSMKNSPYWGANRPSATQEIHRILWNLRVYCRIYNSPPHAPILSQIDSVHYLHPTSRRSISILSSHLRLGPSSGLLCWGFPTKTLYESILSLIHATCPANLGLLRFDHPNNIWRRVQSSKLPVI